MFYSTRYPYQHHYTKANFHEHYMRMALMLACKGFNNLANTAFKEADKYN